MKIRSAILGLTIGLIATSAQAQQRYVQQDVHLSNVNACLSDYYFVGRTISKASFFVTQDEATRGGKLTFDEAARIRARLYSDTYTLKEGIRDNANRNPAECRVMRDRATFILKSILTQNGVPFSEARR